MPPIQTTLVITDAGLIITKKHYSDWREVQDDYYDIYKASLDFNTSGELLGYLIDEYNLDNQEISRLMIWLKSESTIFLDYLSLIPLEDRYFHRLLPEKSCFYKG